MGEEEARALSLRESSGINGSQGKVGAGSWEGKGEEKHPEPLLKMQKGLLVHFP